MMYAYPSYGSGFWLGMGFMMIFGLLFLAGCVLLVVWLVRNAGGRADRDYERRDHAGDIARERYARGEIDKQAYDEICRNLGRR